MRILLDTRMVLWWLADDMQLTPAYRDAIANPDNEPYVSAVTVAEISIKASLGKLTVPEGIGQVVESEAFTELPFTAAHAEALRALPWHHRDPFDRMLIAQASIEGMPLLTADSRIHDYDIECL